MAAQDETQTLMKGNEVIAEAAIRAGCRFYAGYPITPQNEITAYMAQHMPARGGVFIQAESEVSAINMVYGAAAAGARAMTSSSSPGVSLKQEGISYAAGADLPLVIVNISRGGPGLGSIAPAQSDYFQSTRGGGHGDYRCIVLAPKGAGECGSLTCLAFELAERYRVPAIVLADGLIGQMMEGVVLPPENALPPPAHPWACGSRTGAPCSAGDAGTTGVAGGQRTARHITSLHLDAAELDALTAARFQRYARIAEAETRWETTGRPPNGGQPADNRRLVIAAYGSSYRSALGARELACDAGYNVALFRPITLWPFPARALAEFAGGSPVLTVEMSRGQMVEDVKLALYDHSRPNPPPVHFLGHSGGLVPSEEEIFGAIKEILATP